jgi:hypothetical protein
MAAGAASQTDSLWFGTICIPVSNLTFPAAYHISCAAGDTDLYTCPAGKKALVIDVTFTNPTGNPTTVVCDAEVKVSGVYHKFDFVANTAAIGTYGSSNSLAPFLLGAGEIFAVNTNNSGLSVWPWILEFDDTAPIFDARLFSLSIGDNTLFTVPVGKKVAFCSMPGSFGTPSVGKAYYYNLSGGSRTVKINVVPSGGSPAVANAIQNGSVVNHQMAQPQLYGGIAPGDFINVNTDAATATQTAWVIYTQQ